MKFSFDLKKLVNDMRGPKGVAALTEEYERISAEIQKLKNEVKPQAKAQLKKAEVKYASLVKKMHAAQKDLDKEVAKKVSIVKKQAKEVEKNLGQYKKIAVKAFASKKKAAPKRKKTTKKTSKKAASASA